MTKSFFFGASGSAGASPPPPPPPGYTCGGVVFDGATSLLRASLTTPSANGFLSLSLWYYLSTTADSPAFYAVDPQNQEQSVAYVIPEGLAFYANKTGDNASALGANSAAVDAGTGAWVNFIATVDTNHAEGAKLVKLYRNRVDVTDNISDAGVAYVLDYNALPWYIGWDSYTGWVTGYLADVWIAPGQSLLTGSSIAFATLDKFVTAGLKPVDLGADGSTPTGTAPAIFLSIPHGGTPANFATNKGTGGNFTITGALTLSPSSPSD